MYEQGNRLSEVAGSGSAWKLKKNVGVVRPKKLNYFTLSLLFASVDRIEAASHTCI